MRNIGKGLHSSKMARAISYMGSGMDQCFLIRFFGGNHFSNCNQVALSKARKRWLVALASVLLLIAIGIWSATSMLTTYINEYGEEYIGRKLSLKDLDLNPLSGTFKLQELVVYERDGEAVFLSLKKLKLNLDVWAFVSGTYHIDRVEVEGMFANVKHENGRFSFQDILDRYKTDTSAEDDSVTTEPFDLIIKEIAVEESHIVYDDASLPFPLIFEELEAKFPQGVQFLRPELHGTASFVFNKAGRASLQVDYNRNTEAYTAGVAMNRMDIKLLENLIKEQLNISHLKGALSTDLRLVGNLQDPGDIDISGLVGLENASLTDLQDEPVASLQHIGLHIDTFNGKKKQYAISKVILSQPEGIFHLYEEGNNFLSLAHTASQSSETGSSRKASKNFMAQAVYQLVEALKSYAASNLMVDQLSVNGGHFTFHDHTLMDSFAYELSELEMEVSELYFNKDSIPVSITALLNGKGAVELRAFLYPDRLDDLSMELAIENLDVADVSPYCYQHLGRKVLSGNLSGRHVVSVKDHQLVSSNQISIDSFELGDKASHKPTVKVPLKTGAAALKNHKGIIELDLPIMGDLSNPNYKLGKTIGSIFKNLLVKAATSPTRAISKRRKRRKSKD